MALDFVTLLLSHPGEIKAWTLTSSCFPPPGIPASHPAECGGLSGEGPHGGERQGVDAWVGPFAHCPCCWGVRGAASQPAAGLVFLRTLPAAPRGLSALRADCAWWMSGRLSLRLPVPNSRLSPLAQHDPPTFHPPRASVPGPLASSQRKIPSRAPPGA